MTRAALVNSIEDGFAALVLHDTATGSELILARMLDEQGIDMVDVTVEGGQSVDGGLLGWSVHDSVLTLELSQEATETLKLNDHHFTLDIGNSDEIDLKAAMEIVVGEG